MAHPAYRSPVYRRNRAKLLTGNPPCWRCGAPATTADHIVPKSWFIARGLPVDHSLANLRPACHRCNSSTGDRRGRRESRPW